ncbi:hypothetical protein JQ543_19410 [Bradyrhizobium diazoefficiens]|nr:hypothetical protein [Bradyrhizobium diazoefficiens]MBR0849931.1 hypothetical protein [Bradyrhizobium diazoefficiens]
MQFRFAFKHLAAHGFANTALGTSVTGWWSPRYQMQVLQTDNPAYVETMAMNWLSMDHKDVTFVGVVMHGVITMKGKEHTSFILRARAADRPIRMMAYHPYYNNANEEEPWVTPFIDFPPDQAVPADTQKALEGMMIISSLGR